MKIGKALTWDELANLYDEYNNGRAAKTLPMENVRKWAELRPDLFKIDPVETTIHLILEDDMTDESIAQAEQAETKDQEEVTVLTPEGKEVKEALVITREDVDIIDKNPLQVELTADFVKAWDALSSGKVPPDAVLSHEGPGGRYFKYVAHWWISRQLRLAFGPLWDFEVHETTIYDDFSSSAKITLTVYLPISKGELRPVSITCIGVFKGNKSMAKSYLEASAVSRALVKAAQLRFGIGEEFYAGEDEGIPKQTADEAWATLLRYGTERGLVKDDIVKAFKDDPDIEYNLLEDNAVFQKAYGLVGKLIRQKKAETVIDEANGTDGF